MQHDTKPPQANTNSSIAQAIGNSGGGAYSTVSAVQGPTHRDIAKFLIAMSIMIACGFIGQARQDAPAPALTEQQVEWVGGQ